MSHNNNIYFPVFMNQRISLYFVLFHALCVAKQAIGMVHTVIYCMRGWIAFVAFIHISNAIQCMYEGDKFLRESLFENESGDEGDKVTAITARLMTLYYFLNFIVMTHCALFIEHLPIISLSIVTLILSIYMYASEAFYFYTAKVKFQVVFPILTAIFTIVCLAIAPIFFEKEPKKKKVLVAVEDEEEDEEIAFIKQRQAQTLSNLKTKKTQ